MGSDRWTLQGKRLTLDGWNGVGTPPTVELLPAAKPCAEDWRVVDLLSVSDAPFEVDLAWAAGTTAAQRASLTVPRMARVCFLCAWLTVHVRNLSPDPNEVIASASDGRLPTENQFELRGQTTINVVTEVPIPTWAKLWRWETVGAAALGATLRVVDAQGVTRNELLGTAQPQGGWSPVGNADHIEIVPAASADWRMVFLLSL